MVLNPDSLHQLLRSLIRIEGPLHNIANKAHRTASFKYCTLVASFVGANHENKFCLVLSAFIQYINVQRQALHICLSMKTTLSFVLSTKIFSRILAKL